MAAPFTVTSSVYTLHYKEPCSYSLVAVIVKKRLLKEVLTVYKRSAIHLTFVLYGPDISHTYIDSPPFALKRLMCGNVKGFFLIVCSTC
jgi:hypothetical protein